MGNRQWIRTERLRERRARGQLHGQQVRAVEGSVSPVACSDRSRRRQAKRRQFAQKAPFAKAPRTIRAGVQVTVVEHARHRTAATIVPQHPAPRVIAEERDGAATTGLPLDRHATMPAIGIEPALVRMAGERGIV